MTTTHHARLAARRIAQPAFALRPLTFALALALPGMAFAQMAFAQDATSTDTTPKPAPSATTLDTIKVTAQRRVENIQDVPLAITAVSGEKLEVLGSGGEDIRFLSGRLPSLNIESSFGRAFPRFYIRGLGNTDFDLNASQPVSLVLDDIVQENPILKGFPLFDMDQIELLRGPQGTLFGRNSPAGVVKFDSARPEDSFGGYGRVSWGTYNTVNLEGAVTGPLAAGLSGRVSVLHQRRDNWVDNTFNGPGKDLEGYEETAARAQLLFTPSDRFEALVNVHMRHLNGTARLFRASLIAPGTNDIQPGFDPAKVSIDGKNQQSLDQFGANLHLRWSFGFADLISITGYEHVKTFSRGDIDGGSVYVFPPVSLGEALFPAESADGLPRHHQYTQEFRLVSTSEGPADWQVGAFWFDESIHVDSFSYDSLAPGNPENGYATQRQDNTAWALYGSLGWKFSERFSMRGGLRYTNDRKTFVAERVVGPFGPPIAPITVKPHATDLSWDLSASWKLTDATLLYARIAKGFRAPSVQGRLMFADATLPNDELVTVAKSETVISRELGVKGEAFDQRLRYGLALFDYTVHDQQLSAVGGVANVARLVNADRTVGRGVELDLDAWLTEHLLVTVGASYNFTRIKDPTLSVFPCAVNFCTVLDPANPAVPGTVLINGNRLPQAPLQVYNLTARYGVPFGAGELFAYTDWAWRGPVSFFLYDSVSFTSKPLLEGGLRLGYQWQNGDREVAVFGRNILDKRAVVGGIDFNNLTGFINEPRTFGVQVSARF